MIIFLEHISLIGLIISKTRMEPVVYNLTSYYSGLIDLTPLVISSELVNNPYISPDMYVDSINFDIEYANKIINNDKYFSLFLSPIVASYQGKVSIIMVKHDPYRDAFMESIIKLIQQRYGYNCWIVETIDDIECLREPSFSPQGILTLGEDLKRYDGLYTMGYCDLIDGNINKE